MIIEQVFPAVLTKKSTLLERLIAEAKKRGVSGCEIFISIVPKQLLGAGAFFDGMTNLWRYEFGVPFNVGEGLVFGTHMWPPVECLFKAIMCAYYRLPVITRTDYLNRLANPQKHQETLVEMIPGYKIDPAVAVQFEVSGRGVGNRTIDWAIEPHDGRLILLDVKRRIFDFIKQAERIHCETTAPEPDHNPELLFRSIESKFEPADPNVQLQGAWIITDIKQDEKALFNAFVALDQSKVHFAIIGDWRPDVHILTIRDEDEHYLRELFHAEKSVRFTFSQEKG